MRQLFLSFGSALVACSASIAPGNPPASTPAGSAAIIAPSASAAAPAPSATASQAVKSIPLPGATGPVTLDYLACDRARGRVWVPVGDTGSADVFDVASAKFTRVDGFKTESREVRGKTRMLGPSAAAVGEGVVYVGNRATSEVCPVNAQTLERGRCLELPAPIDGVAYVASAREVWVTMPKTQSLAVLDASRPEALGSKLVIKTPGAPEGYAVDLSRGLFFTNLEDKNQTLVIDIKTHAIRATWPLDCNADGPRGVAVDSARNFVIVACTESIRVLDGGHAGAQLGKLDTGAGVDNIEYVDSSRLVYAAAAKAARLTVARIDDQGRPSIVATPGTAEGARNAVVDARGNVYVADPKQARLLILAPAAPVSP
jgi:DNA-binding beta-propeller fold protein YncE